MVGLKVPWEESRNLDGGTKWKWQPIEEGFSRSAIGKGGPTIRRIDPNRAMGAATVSGSPSAPIKPGIGCKLGTVCQNPIPGPCHVEPAGQSLSYQRQEAPMACEALISVEVAKNS
ncbi:hypothetical protein KM043_001265 [Ampulex compressa]|nr:hypothetical protein KM043_001265 [Ampulex compressa]